MWATRIDDILAALKLYVVSYVEFQHQTIRAFICDSKNILSDHQFDVKRWGIPCETAEQTQWGLNNSKFKNTTTSTTECCLWSMLEPKKSKDILLSFYSFLKLLERYCSDHHGDKLFHDAVAIEPIVMLHLCTLFIFSLWYRTNTPCKDVLRNRQISTVWLKTEKNNGGRVCRATKSCRLCIIQILIF